MERDPLDSAERSKPVDVQFSGDHRRAEPSGASFRESKHEVVPSKHPGGRPHKRWRIGVVRIDPGKYPQFAADKDHPFARLSAEERLKEFDSFFARLMARNGKSGDRSAAA